MVIKRFCYNTLLLQYFQKTQKLKNGRGSLPSVVHIKILSLFTISSVQARMLFVYPVHSSAFSNINYSVMPFSDIVHDALTQIDSFFFSLQDKAREIIITYRFIPKAIVITITAFLQFSHFIDLLILLLKSASPTLQKYW